MIMDYCKNPSLPQQELLFSENSSGEPCLKFYYLDAYEDQQPGIVHLFGKVYLISTNTYASCCVTLENIPRRVNLLPQETTTENPNSLDSVYTEFKQYANKSKIRDFEWKEVEKKYAFDIEGIPEKATYLNIRYPSLYPKLGNDYYGKAIKRIFETSVNALEILLTEEKLKEPCWIDIKFPELVAPQLKTTWCQFQVKCSKKENIRVIESDNDQKLEIPPVVSTTLNVKTALNSNGKGLEVVMIHMLSNKNFDISGQSDRPPIEEEWCLISKPSNCLFYSDVDKNNDLTSINGIRCKNEAHLLNIFLDIFISLDPDILVGYDCNLTFINLINRISSLVPKQFQNKLNRLKKGDFANLKPRFMVRQGLCRPLCDVKQAISNIYPKINQLNLDTTCLRFLGTPLGHIQHISPTTILKFYSPQPQLTELIKIIKTETLCIKSLSDKMNLIPLAVEMTTIVGHVLSRMLGFPKNERNEYLLFHEFHKAGYIIPDKKTHEIIKYRGALVLDAKRGLHENITVLMDYNSLYPSIIQEYNLCYTTIPGVGFKPLEEIKIPSGDVSPGILPTVMGRIVESRREAKNLLKNPIISSAEKVQCESRQMALKLIANTFYGCLGSPYFRFYCPNIAATIAAKGREILEYTKTIVESMNFDVLYGDTDSLMINTKQNDISQAKKIAASIKEKVNKQYKYINLELDAIYKYTLIANKKSYTGLLIDDDDDKQVLVAKGTLPGEHDYCKLVHKTLNYIIEEIFTDKPLETRIDNIKEYLNEIHKSEENKEYEKFHPDLVMKKLLERDPDNLSKARAHEYLAVRLNADPGGERKWKQGDYLSYIICTDGSNNPPEKRAYLIDSANTKLKFAPDMNFYIKQQLIPILDKFCRPIPGLEGYIIASCLGREPNDELPNLIGQAHEPDESLYCIGPEPFQFTCPKCLAYNKIEGFSRLVGGKHIPVLSSCTSVDCDNAPWQYVNKIAENLQSQLNDLVKKYSDSGPMICANTDCKYVNKNTKLIKVCPLCQASIVFLDDTPVLYGQLCRWQKWLDVKSQKDVAEQDINQEVIEAYVKLYALVDKCLNRQCTGVFNMSDIFQKI